MSPRGSSLAILVLAVSLPVTAEANCGCEATGRPCTEEVLATAALPAPAVAVAPVSTSEGMAFPITECWDCGGATNPLPLLLWGLLFPMMVVVKRVVCGSDRLIVLRLTDPPSPRMPVWTTSRSLPRFTLRSSLS